MSNRRIFTFWEPKGLIPAYLRLCMKTWSKYLPDYEIVLLDYASLSEWLDSSDLDLEELKKHPSLAVQSDAIRVALLARYGGVWMDLDTIVISSKWKDVIEASDRFTLISRHIGFISVGQGNEIAIEWLKNVKRRLKYAAFYRKTIPLPIRFLFYVAAHLGMRRHALCDTWDFLGNAPLKPILNQKTGMFRSLNQDELISFPELIGQTAGKSPSQCYVDYYFGGSMDSLDWMSRCGGLICLHNSWTPKKFKLMSESGVLKSNTGIAQLLRTVL